MSLLKLGGIQIGQSNSASNNFHWRNLLDGLLRLSRGNAGSPITDVMRVKADNSVEFPGGVASGVLGAGQTWQDVTASRTVGITYTNVTYKPISINVILLHSAGSVAGYLIVDGATVDLSTLTNNTSGAYGHLRAIIPPWSTYSVGVSGGSVISWLELR